MCIYIYTYSQIDTGSSSKQLAAQIQRMLSEKRCCVTILRVKNLRARRPSCQPPPQPTPCVPHICIYICIQTQYIIDLSLFGVYHIKYIYIFPNKIQYIHKIYSMYTYIHSMHIHTHNKYIYTYIHTHYILYVFVVCYMLYINKVYVQCIYIYVYIQNIYVYTINIYTRYIYIHYIYTIYIYIYIQ